MKPIPKNGSRTDLAQWAHDFKTETLSFLVSSSQERLKKTREHAARFQEADPTDKFGLGRMLKGHERELSQLLEENQQELASLQEMSPIEYFDRVGANNRR